MKFSTRSFIMPRTNPNETGYDRFIISPSRHTKGFNDHKSFKYSNTLMKFGTYKFYKSLNMCAEFQEDQSKIDHSSHINPSSENYFKGHKSH